MCGWKEVPLGPVYKSINFLEGYKWCAQKNHSQAQVHNWENIGQINCAQHYK